MAKDIEKAIIAEKEYLADTNHNTFPLVDRVKEFGFENLDDYFYNKKVYLMHQLNLDFNYEKVEDVFNVGIVAVNSGTPLLMAVGEECTWAWVSRDAFDSEKAEELNVKICNWPYPGGTIITDSNDFNVAMVLPSYIDANRTFIANRIIDFIKSRGITAEYVDNDILVDGKKIAGITGYNTEKSFLFCMSLSLSDHSDLIKQLCTKNSVKVPGFIIGITRQEFEEEFSSWLHSI